MAEFDLPAYLARIGFSGVPRADAATLREICRLQPMAIAFENLTPFAGQPVSLEIGALQDKMIAGRRGGYCFEQNTLLAHALEAIGFPFFGLQARVRWNIPDGQVTPQTHMMLAVRADGADWIADAGFGGVTLTAPLRLEVREAEQATPHEAFLLRGSGMEFMLYLSAAGRLRPVVHFTMERRYPADFELANHYVATHPQSRFRTSLVVSRPAPGVRHVLHNRTITEYRGGAASERTLTDTEVEAAMDELFGIDIPDRGAFRRALAALPR